MCARGRADAEVALHVGFGGWALEHVRIDIDEEALVAFDAFIETWGVTLTKDRDALLAFYDFPAEHWKHLRTTNVIESSFATIRHRTVRSKGCLSNKTALAMIF